MVHDTRRCGSPDVFINPKHARMRLHLKSRHVCDMDISAGDDSVTANTPVFDPRPREQSRVLQLPVFNDVKTEDDMIAYNEALNISADQRYPSERSLTNRRRSHPNLDNSANCQIPLNFPTPPPSTERRGNSAFLQQKHSVEDRAIEEIIIDLDDEIDEAEGGGGDSPEYAPNENIQISEEDQRIFFNKRPKMSKIKTEARKMQDREYINQVRQLKEKAAALRKLTCSDAQVSSRAQKPSDSMSRTQALQASTSRKNQIAYEIHKVTKRIQKSNAHSTNNSPNRRPIQADNLYLPSTSQNGPSYHPSPSQIHDSHRIPQPLSGANTFDRLILAACSTVQQQKEKEKEKEQEVNKRIIQAGSLQNIELRIDNIVDKHVDGLSIGSGTGPSETRKNAGKNQYADDVISLHSGDSSPYEATTPPYIPTTPPRLDELEQINTLANQYTSQSRSNSGPDNEAVVVCLSSDEESMYEYNSGAGKKYNSTQNSGTRTEKTPTVGSSSRHDGRISGSKHQEPRVDVENGNIITIDDGETLSPSFQIQVIKDMERSNRRVQSSDIVSALECELSRNSSANRAGDNAVHDKRPRSEKRRKRPPEEPELFASEDDIIGGRSKENGHNSNRSLTFSKETTKKKADSSKSRKYYMHSNTSTSASESTSNIIIRERHSERTTKPKRRRISKS